MRNPILEAVCLNVSFGEEDDRHHVVKDVSFQIGRGECYGLIGESGCGKSTVLRAAAGLNPDYEGAIVLDRREQPNARRGADFLRRVQMVFQDPYASLHPRKMVDKVLREPLQSTGSTASASASTRCWCRSGWTQPSAIATRTSCPAASASGSPSPAR